MTTQEIIIQLLEEKGMITNMQKDADLNIG